MKVIKWIVVICLASVVVIVAVSFIRNKMIGPVGWAIDDAEKNLRARMKDPDSMVIRSYYVIEKRKEGALEISICGFVDGRNSFGAYSGDARFVSRSSSNRQLKYFNTQAVELESPLETKDAHSVNMLSGFELVYWNEYCVDESHPALTAKP